MAVIPSFLPSVFPSFRPSESERFFVSITVGGFAFGLIGVERIPHALMLILAAGVLMQWTNALEEASRRGARAVRLKQFSPRGVWVKAGITLVGVGAVAGVLALGGASAAAVLTGAACPPHDAGGVAKYILPIVLGHHEKAGGAMRRGLPFVLLTVLIVPAAASAQQGPPFPDAAREWLSRDLPFRFQAMIALGDSLFNNGSCTRCHGDDATGTRRAPNLTDAEWVQSEDDLEGIFQVIFWGVRRRDFADETRRFEMNPQGGMNITWDQTRALAAYVWSLSNMPAQ